MQKHEHWPDSMTSKSSAHLFVCWKTKSLFTKERLRLDKQEDSRDVTAKKSVEWQDYRQDFLKRCTSCPATKLAVIVGASKAFQA